jgi:hypothetical protein
LDTPASSHDGTRAHPSRAGGQEKGRPLVSPTGSFSQNRRRASDEKLAGCKDDADTPKGEKASRTAAGRLADCVSKEPASLPLLLPRQTFRPIVRIQSARTAVHSFTPTLEGQLSTVGDPGLSRAAFDLPRGTSRTVPRQIRAPKTASSSYQRRATFIAHRIGGPRPAPTGLSPAVVPFSKGLRLGPTHPTTPAPRPRAVSRPVWAGPRSLGDPGIGARLAAPPGLSQPSTPESDDA